LNHKESWNCNHRRKFADDKLTQGRWNTRLFEEHRKRRGGDLIFPNKGKGGIAGGNTDGGTGSRVSEKWVGDGTKLPSF